MRYQTIKRRMRLSGLTERQLVGMFNMMRGISDEDTVVNGKHNNTWVNAVRIAHTWENVGENKPS